MKHYIYIARIDDEIVYIGKGVGKRYEHVNSGISHNYFLNKAHFSGIVMDVEIYQRFDTDEEALAAESALIKLHNPKWNNMNNPTKRPNKGLRARNGKGVQFKKSKSVNPWCAYIHIDGKKVHIGYYATEEEAQKARQAYA